MEGKDNPCLLCGSQRGKDKISAVRRRKGRRRQKENKASDCLVRIKRRIKSELRGDFAAVDFREELCYHSLPKKQTEEEKMQKENKVISCRQKGRNP